MLNERRERRHIRTQAFVQVVIDAKVCGVDICSVFSRQQFRKQYINVDAFGCPRVQALDRDLLAAKNCMVISICAITICAATDVLRVAPPSDCRPLRSTAAEELERAYSPTAVESASSTSCACSPLHRDSSCGDPHCRWVRPRPTFTAEREAQDVEYAAAVRYEEDRDEEERQREEAERALVGPVQVDVVRAARLRRLAGGGETS